MDSKGLLMEALAVGLMTVIIGYLSGYVLSRVIVLTDNKNYIMAKSLFLTGVLVHLISQYTGINQWYCKNGVACKNHSS